MDAWQWFTVLVPVVVIVQAILTKRIIISLLGGALFAFLGVAFTTETPIEQSIVLPYYGLKSTLIDTGHLMVIAFSILIASTVILLQRSGDMEALVTRIAKKATTRKSGQVVTILAGFLIFFDDYANSLVVGNAMRPLTDKLKISREKLSFLVDATAAPLAAIAFVTTWVGAEIGYIADAMVDLPEQVPPYEVFIGSLPYAFYPLLTLAFTFIIALSGRDFGAMLVAERKTQKSVLPPKQSTSDKPHAYIWPVVVIALLIGVTLGMLIATSNASFGEGWVAVLGGGDAYIALLVASGLTFALSVGYYTKRLGWRTGIQTIWEGARMLGQAIAVLCAAWFFAEALGVLGTADTLTMLLSESLPAEYLPFSVFLLSALVAFSTGSSWSTMAILYGLVIPLAFQIGGSCTDPIFLASVSAVLAGAVFGDHCSPISDTTILSAMASDCDQVAHVRTQLPYALTIGLVAAVGGYLLIGFGFNSWLSLLLSTFILLIVVYVFGRKSD